jgi:hypothetical protein
MLGKVLKRAMIGANDQALSTAGARMTRPAGQRTFSFAIGLLDCSSLVVVVAI